MAETMTCVSCRHWTRGPAPDGFVAVEGTCRRFPVTVVTDDEHWCGEHSPVFTVTVEGLHLDGDGRVVDSVEVGVGDVR